MVNNQEKWFFTHAGGQFVRREPKNQRRMGRRSLSLPALPFLLIVQPYLPAYQGARREGAGSVRNSEHLQKRHEGERQKCQTSKQRKALHQSLSLPHGLADQSSLLHGRYALLRARRKRKKRTTPAQ